MKNAYIAAVSSGPAGSAYWAQLQPPDHACPIPRPNFVLVSVNQRIDGRGINQTFRHQK